MKLKEYSPDNCESILRNKATAPFITLCPKSGVFNFNKKACEKMGLAFGDNFIILQEEEEYGNFYIEKSNGKGFKLRASKSINGVLFSNCKQLAETIIDQMKKNIIPGKKSIRILIAGQPTKVDGRVLWGLL